jgi:hypothetical protein
MEGKMLMIKHISSVLLVLLLIMPSAKASDLNVVDEKYQITNTDYYTVKIGEYWGIIDGDGNYLVEAIYDSIDTYFCHGRLRFCLDGLYGYFDESFNIIIKAQFLQTKKCAPCQDNFLLFLMDHIFTNS